METNGAGGGIRTHDLLITNQLLYQLSYASIKDRKYMAFRLRYFVATPGQGQTACLAIALATAEAP